MGAKYTLGAVPQSNGNTLGQSKANALQLSDGSLVQVLYEPSTGYSRLVRSTGDRTAAPVVIFETGAHAFDVNNPVYAITRDDLDNVYVLGKSGTTGSLRLVSLIKGGTPSSPTWTAARSTTFSSGRTDYDVYTAVMYWVNTGTNGGRLVALLHMGDYSLVHMASMILPDKIGSAAPTVATEALTGQGTNTTNFAGMVDMRQDGFGSADFLFTMPRTPTNPTFVIFRATVPATAAITYTEITTIGNSANATHQGVFITRVGAGKFVIVYIDGNARFRAQAFSLTSAIGSAAAAADSLGFDIQGTTLLRWSAFADPLLNGKAWTLARISQSGVNHQFGRLGVTLTGTTLTWDTQVTNDDIIAGPGTNYVQAYRVRTAHDVTSSVVDWMTTLMPNSADAFGTYGDTTNFNQLPNAPTITAPADASTQDRGQAIRVAVTHSDPDGNPQAGLKVQYRVAGTLGGWTELTRSDAVGYIDVATNTLAGNIVVRAATSDGTGYGPWSAERTFVAADASGGTTSSAPTRLDPASLLSLAQTQRALSPAVT